MGSLYNACVCGRPDSIRDFAEWRGELDGGNRAFDHMERHGQFCQHGLLQDRVEHGWRSHMAGVRDSKRPDPERTLQSNRAQLQLDDWQLVEHQPGADTHSGAECQRQHSGDEHQCCQLYNQPAGDRTDHDAQQPQCRGDVAGRHKPNSGLVGQRGHEPDQLLCGKAVHQQWRQLHRHLLASERLDAVLQLHAHQRPSHHHSRLLGPRLQLQRHRPGWGHKQRSFHHQQSRAGAFDHHHRVQPGNSDRRNRVCGGAGRDGDGRHDAL